VDERDIDRDWISWVSPLAKALVGDRVPFNAPGGEQNFEIIAVRFDDRTSEK
jgi:transcription elongation factor GreB